MLDDAEVVLAVGIVVVSEAFKRSHVGQKRGSALAGQGFDAGGDDDHAADEGAAEGVVELTELVEPSPNDLRS